MEMQFLITLMVKQRLSSKAIAPKYLWTNFLQTVRQSISDFLAVASSRAAALK